MITYWQLLLALLATGGLCGFVFWRCLWTRFFKIAYLNAIHISEPALYHAVCNGELFQYAEENSEQGQENRVEPEKESGESRESSKEAL